MSEINGRLGSQEQQDDKEDVQRSSSRLQGEPAQRIEGAKEEAAR